MLDHSRPPAVIPAVRRSCPCMKMGRWIHAAAGRAVEEIIQLPGTREASTLETPIGNRTWK